MAKKIEIQPAIWEPTDESESEDDEMQTATKNIKTEAPSTLAETTSTSAEPREPLVVRRGRDREIRHFYGHNVKVTRIENSPGKNGNNEEAGKEGESGKKPRDATNEN